MVVKRSVRCANCGGYMSLYMNEKQKFKGKTATCKCGSTYKCIKECQGITKWREV